MGEERKNRLKQFVEVTTRDLRVSSEQPPLFSTRKLSWQIDFRVTGIHLLLWFLLVKTVLSAGHRGKSLKFLSHSREEHSSLVLRE